ncbi:MAG: monofunctional biosynthetic peptidoglycan transglycosylase [Elusimicrobia bacterium]|nr:monofunctional biosynthetic peptidoglycan transglycosylase [Elusimicrobiota bacterium]
MDIRRAVNRRRWRVRVAAGVLVSSGTWAAWLVHFPGSLDELRSGNPGITNLMEVRREQAREDGEDHPVRQSWVPLAEVSPHLRRAIVLAEDKRFYQHRGIDFISLREAVKHNWEHKRFCRGASTITQQVVKNIYLTNDKSIFRKLREMTLAWRIDRDLSKGRILEIYLNIVEWGDGVYGAEAASRIYFRRPASELNFNQALALAAVLPSPLRHSPTIQGRYLTLRKVQLLRRMKRNGYPVPRGLLESASRRLPWPVNEKRLEQELERYFMGIR